MQWDGIILSPIAQPSGQCPHATQTHSTGMSVSAGLTGEPPIKFLTYYNSLTVVKSMRISPWAWIPLAS